jgi:hypothetical protein
MKVIIEIEEQDDMQKVEAFLKSFEITKIQIGDLQRQQKLQNFFDYLNIVFSILLDIKVINAFKIPTYIF